MKILIMAGGSGERFWPLSRKEKPKQLLSLISEKSMIRETFDRFLSLVDVEDIFIATNKLQVPGIQKEIPELQLENIIVEPAFRDTAAAIAYGSAVIAKTEENPTIVVVASDHLIQKETEFLDAIKQADKEAESGSIITLGIKPTRPETGYGYIKINNSNTNEVQKVEEFLEKPNKEVATKYLESGNYVWNSGMFIFKYQTMTEEMMNYIPNHITVINDLKEHINQNDGYELCEKVAPYFGRFERISIDFAVMEKSDKIVCIPVDIGWSDIGGYNTLADIFASDENNNITRGCSYYCVDSSNNIIISDNPEKVISTIGISNTIVAVSGDEILISNRDNTEQIKKIVKMLEK